ncbi:hypothetical protein NDU88_004667, partial [Pleurodeles waltl]
VSSSYLYEVSAFFCGDALRFLGIKNAPSKSAGNALGGTLWQSVHPPGKRGKYMHTTKADGVGPSGLSS